MRGQPLTTIDNENDDIGLDHCLLGLLGHLVHDAFFGDRLKTTGIDHQKRTFADPAFAVVTVPGQSGQVCDQRIA